MNWNLLVIDEQLGKSVSGAQLPPALRGRPRTTGAVEFGDSLQSGTVAWKPMKDAERREHRREDRG